MTGRYIGGDDVTLLASMCKLKAGRLGRELVDSCLQYWGGMGYTNDVIISRIFRYIWKFNVDYIMYSIDIAFCTIIVVQITVS